MAGVRPLAYWDVLGRAQADHWLEGDDRQISGRMINGRFIADDFGQWLMRLSMGSGSHLFRPMPSETVQ